MCEKSKHVKRFFVLLNHPAPLQKAIPMGVLKDASHLQFLYEKTRNTVFLSTKEVKGLGFQPPQESNIYLVPIEIPRDWFIH